MNPNRARRVSKMQWPKIGRRPLLRGMLAGIAGGFGLSWLTSCSGEEASQPIRPTSELVGALREHFHYLHFDDAVAEAFEHDFERVFGAWQPGTSAKLNTRFLASTDFFQTGADESRPLQYAQFFDPYISPCYNPFAS